MSSKIETHDRKRKNLRGGRVLAEIAFFILYIIRSAQMIVGQRAVGKWTIVETALTLTLVMLVYFTLRLIIVERRIRRDPLLKEALYDELDRLNELKSWKFAFYSLILFNLIAVYLFHIMAIPLKEPIVLIITNLMIGSISFDVARYVLDR